MSRACPRCELALTPRESQGVEVDICAECGGIFLDATEFDELVAKRFEGKPLESLFAFMSEEVPDGIACPGCNASMHQLSYEGIEIDRCPDCEGIFIDGYERREFAARASEAEIEAHREEVVQCDGCGQIVPLRLCIRRMDAYWCEACVVAGNHPGKEAALVGVKEMQASAAVSLARGKMRQQESRERSKLRRTLNERMRHRYKPHALELGLMETIARWVDNLFNR